MIPLSEIDDDYVRRVERERRRRERELWLLLLALLGVTERQTAAAVMHGYDWPIAVRNIVVGNDHFRGGVRDFAITMARAHRDGYRRVGLAAGTRDVRKSDAGTLRELVNVYADAAREAAVAMTDSIVAAVAEALRLREPGVSVRETVADAFDAAGYTASSPNGIRLAAERTVVRAHNGGIFAVVNERPDLEVTGLEHVSIVDERTTQICLERAGLRLPIDHPYWTRNICPLHWRCRSTHRPLFGDFVPTDVLPATPPMPGFGMNPIPFRRAA